MSTDPRSFAICTLGCRVNQEEGMAIVAQFVKNGWEKVDFTESADVYIINTCTVTHLADRKSRQMIRSAVKKNPEAFIVACGCYTQVNAEAVREIEGVDLILGTTERAEIFGRVSQALTHRGLSAQVYVADLIHERSFLSFEGEAEQSERARGFLKIQDGCNQFCSYCIVPYARGRERSKPFDLVIKQVGELVKSGHSEVVLSGIHVGNYGHDLEPKRSLAHIVLALGELPGLRRLRFGSIEPQEVTKELIQALVASPNACPHLHIPLQSGCDKTLNRMNRHYNTADFATLMNELRLGIPQLSVSTDLMVGFPDETDEDFDATCKFVKEMGFSDIHVFPYSPRKGTPAADFLNQVSPQVKKERVAKITEITSVLRDDVFHSHFCCPAEIFLEQKRILGGKEYYIGYSEHFLPYALPAKGLKRGEIVMVMTEGICHDMLSGIVLEKS